MGSNGLHLVQSWCSCTNMTYLTECFRTSVVGNCALAFVFEGEMFEWRASELAVTSSQSWSDNESMTVAILLIHCASIYSKGGGVLCKMSYDVTMLFPYHKDSWGYALCHSDIFEWSLYFTSDCSLSWEQFSLGSFCGSTQLGSAFHTLRCLAKLFPLF